MLLHGVEAIACYGHMMQAHVPKMVALLAERKLSLADISAEAVVTANFA